MLSQILRDARKYEETMERGIDERLRPGVSFVCTGRLDE